MEKAQYIFAFNLSEHPLIGFRDKIKMMYIKILRKFVEDVCKDDMILQKLDFYSEILLNEENLIELNDVSTDNALSYLLSHKYTPWREKYKYILICDIALILEEREKIISALEKLKKYLIEKKYIKLMNYSQNLFDDKIDSKFSKYTENLINQYKMNISFLQKNEKKIVFTATMSAGKSTLINALIGKKVARTAVEACTGNISYFRNKAFEDGKFAMTTDDVKLNVSISELWTFSWDKTPQIFTNFNFAIPVQEKICLIDTPGVNSSLNDKHEEYSKRLIKNNDYDKLVYIFNANKLGTDEEISHLKWVSQNVDKDKIIFVINKLDTYKKSEDRIEETIEKVKNDLSVFGFNDSVICPLSAYTGLLEKMKINNIAFSEDEEDEYSYYIKKFSKDEYDFSSFYESSSYENLLCKSGLLGLESVLFQKGLVHEKSIY